MGPRLFSRGKMVSGYTKSHESSLLQWGRGFSAAERAGHADHSTTLESSAWPQLRYRANRRFAAMYIPVIGTPRCYTPVGAKIPNSALNRCGSRSLSASSYDCICVVLSALSCCIFSNINSCERRSVMGRYPTSRHATLHGPAPSPPYMASTTHRPCAPRSPLCLQHTSAPQARPVRGAPQPIHTPAPPGLLKKSPPDTTPSPAVPVAIIRIP